jgi:hypothetical protein
MNCDEFRSRHKTPVVELIPLPTGAQFLNVIGSVFSGMARAILHNSNYGNVDECKSAINMYIADRNRAFVEGPRRAGNKIWGKEQVEPCLRKKTIARILAGASLTGLQRNSHTDDMRRLLLARAAVAAIHPTGKLSRDTSMSARNRVRAQFSPQSSGASIIRPSRNVSGCAIAIAICDFFQKSRKRSNADSIGPSATTLLSWRRSAGEGEAGARLDQRERPTSTERAQHRIKLRAECLRGLQELGGGFPKRSMMPLWSDTGSAQLVPC